MNTASITCLKRFLIQFAFAFNLLAAGALSAADAELLAGKWSVKKTNDKGENYTQTLEFKQNKFVFQRLGADDRVEVVAEGELKLEKAGPFKSARFLHIRAGDSAADLEAVDEEYVSVYLLDGDSWTVASNFDRPREEKPSLEAYQRVKTAEARTLVIDDIELADTPQSATWFFCFEAKAGGESRRHHVEDKGYDKNQVTIPMALELPAVRAGQKCSFTVQLDDVDADACTDSADNRSAGEFSASEHGSQSYKPEDNWRYLIHWHLKP